MANNVLSSMANASEAVVPRLARAVSLTLRVLLVGLICFLGTEIGFAHKVPPHNISPLWPTVAILFSVLVVTPVRHWWAYVMAGYFTSLINDARAGFPLPSILFVIAGVLELLVAAVGVRLFAEGPRAFLRLRGVMVYLGIAVILAPFLSAFVAACAAQPDHYWFYWRVWFFSEALAYLTLAPAILTWIALAGRAWKPVFFANFLEAGVLCCGLIAVMITVFCSTAASDGRVPALVYLPLPFLLWAAVRFGPVGINTALLLVAFLSISGAVAGRGPFVVSSPDENVLSLQLFLIAIAVPLMLLAAVIREGREKTMILAESEARFRTMTDGAPMLVWMADADKRCSYFNKPWLEFTGRKVEQELGEGWAEGVHPEDLRRCLSTYGAAFDARERFQMEYRLRHRDGTYRWIVDCGVPRFSEGGVFAGYIGSCMDIADRKQVEEQRRELTHLARVAMLGEFSGALAHELNQPLTAILSNAQAARRLVTKEPPDLAELKTILQDIVDEDKRAGEVLRRLRLLLKKGEMAFDAIDVNQVATDVLDLAHADLASRCVAVNCQLASALPMVRGDPVQLQQVLLNLIGNACDAMTATETTMRRLTIATQRNEDSMVQIAVTDCGVGIPEETMSRLFDAFFTTKQQGLGLGLTISRSIVSAHGGRLWASNNAGRGATFFLALPSYNGEPS